MKVFMAINKSNLDDGFKNLINILVYQYQTGDFKEVKKTFKQLSKLLFFAESFNKKLNKKMKNNKEKEIESENITE